MSLSYVLTVVMLIHVLGGLDKPGHTAAIEAKPLKLISKHPAFAGLHLQRVGELHLAIRPGRRTADDVENIGGQDVTTNDCQIEGASSLAGFSTISVTRVSPSRSVVPAITPYLSISSMGTS